jgi:hypothetical protein
MSSIYADSRFFHNAVKEALAGLNRAMSALSFSDPAMLVVFGMQVAARALRLEKDVGRRAPYGAYAIMRAIARNLRPETRGEYAQEVFDLCMCFERPPALNSLTLAACRSVLHVGFAATSIVAPGFKRPGTTFGVEYGIRDALSEACTAAAWSVYPSYDDLKIVDWRCLTDTEAASRDASDQAYRTELLKQIRGTSWLMKQDENATRCISQ